MTGLSWRPGCVPFGELREVHVNYWGADGYRHRGLLIARASVARRVAAVFVDLYGLGYRLRSLHPVDRYGPSPRGPGASDYASMAAGNTSMFNCRYAVGRESAGVWSPHATGLSLDINPWENPYRGPGGVYPNAWWLVHRHGSAMLIRPGGPVVRILARHGWRWSGSRDLHHFDYRG